MRTLTGEPTQGKERNTWRKLENRKNHEEPNSNNKNNMWMATTTTSSLRMLLPNSLRAHAPWPEPLYTTAFNHINQCRTRNGYQRDNLKTHHDDCW